MPLEVLLQALRSARVGGFSVRDYSVYCSESRRLSLGIKDRETGNAQAPLSVSESCGASYRLIWDDGLVSRGSLERRQITDDPREALVQARSAAYDDPDAAHVLGPAAIPQVRLHDAGVARMAGGAADPLAPRLERIRECTVEQATWSASFSAAESRSRLVTSAGLEAETRGTSFGWHVTLDGEIGDGFSARAAEPEGSFLSRLQRLTDLARLLTRPARPMTGGVRPLILHPRVVREYALATLLHHLEGSTVDHGEGCFARERFGAAEPAFREDLALAIDPRRPLKSGSYAFTVEGVPAQRTALIERGRLVQPVLDLKYSRRLGLPPTALPYAADTLQFEGPPVLELSPALQRAEGGALVLAVLGAHTQDSASGDFSLSAPQVLRIGPDGLEGRLRATISGNLFDALRDDGLRFVHFEGEEIPGMLLECRIDPR